MQIFDLVPVSCTDGECHLFVPSLFSSFWLALSPSCLLFPFFHLFFSFSRLSFSLSSPILCLSCLSISPFLCLLCLHLPFYCSPSYSLEAYQNHGLVAGHRLLRGRLWWPEKDRKETTDVPLEFFQHRKQVYQKVVDYEEGGAQQLTKAEGYLQPQEGTHLLKCSFFQTVRCV